MDSQTQSKAGQQKDARSFRVAVASYALEYLSSRIANEQIEVQFPAAAAVDPKHWSPSVDEAIALQAADLIVVNGSSARYAEWLKRVSIDYSKLCSSTRNFAVDEFLKVSDYQLVHSHGPEGEHSHAYFVPYTWLDPDLARKQAKTICASLIDTYPEFQADLESNLDRLDADLAELSQLADAIKDGSQTGICSSPYLKMFARRMGLGDYHLLKFSAGEFEDLDKFQTDLETLKEQSAAQIFLTHYELETKVAAIVKRCGLRVVRIDLLEKATGKEFIGQMKQNMERLRAALSD